MFFLFFKLEAEKCGRFLNFPLLFCYYCYIYRFQVCISFWVLLLPHNLKSTDSKPFSGYIYGFKCHSSNFSLVRSCFSFQIFFVDTGLVSNHFLKLFADLFPNFIIVFLTIQDLLQYQKKHIFSFIKISFTCTHFWEQYT